MLLWQHGLLVERFIHTLWLVCRKCSKMDIRQFMKKKAFLKAEMQKTFLTKH